MASASSEAFAPFPDYASAMEFLIEVVQQLSFARDLERIMAVVRRAARRLTNADGATFVLRDGNHCFYADEEAISPLWKGSRFPMQQCVSGWAMQQRTVVVIDDIYADARIPADLYRNTFVRSLVMVPIRASSPVGAVGIYWAKPHRPSAQQIKLLQALADTTAVAMDNVQLHAELEQRVRERTAQLEEAYREIRQLSLKDELTGLLNRRGFVLLASQQLRIARRSNAAAWLLFADLDGLKRVNDECGHEEGDRLIAGAAEALQEAFREYDIVARIGGDEFVVFGVSEQQPTRLRRRLQMSVERLRQKGGRLLSMSVGMVRCEPGRPVSLERLLQQADAAMYKAKRAQRRSAAGSTAVPCGSSSAGTEDPFAV